MSYVDSDHCLGTYVPKQWSNLEKWVIKSGLINQSKRYLNFSILNYLFFLEKMGIKVLKDQK
jgi:hypothetical protein